MSVGRRFYSPNEKKCRNEKKARKIMGERAPHTTAGNVGKYCQKAWFCPILAFLMCIW